jgi:hypothetical protein
VAATRCPKDASDNRLIDVFGPKGEREEAVDARRSLCPEAATSCSSLRL